LLHAYVKADKGRRNAYFVKNSSLMCFANIIGLGISENWNEGSYKLTINASLGQWLEHRS
jgi:hypothetical protein